MAEAGQAGTGLALPAAGRVSLERVGALAGDLRGRWLAMPPARRRWMGTSALLIAAVIAGMAVVCGPDGLAGAVLRAGCEGHAADCAGAVGGGDCHTR